MKLTAIILLIACMVASAKGHTQNITLNERGAPLQKIFKEINRQTGYQFFYKDELLDKAGKIDVVVKNMSLEQVLDICFKNLNITYTISDKTIIVKEKSPNEEANLRNEPPPPIDVTGKVTDADGNPLAGASVKVKGSSLGTTTNNDGVFVLKGVDDNATLEISFVGYETYTVAVANKSTIVASLKVKPESLNEVVINKGYYTEKQRTSVSNVGRVTAKDIEKQPVQNALLALQGRVTGVFVSQGTGIAGGGLSIRIQGQNSIRSGNDPLYVVDGVPYAPIFTSTGLDNVLKGQNMNGNPLNYLTTSDIESIEILKDADATAIYGSRAANGAVLITTKKGGSGKLRTSISLQQGWGQVERNIKMLNTRQYLDIRYEALKNDGIDLSSLNQNGNYDLTVWDSTRYTNWQKVLIGGTSKYTNVNSSVSGGSQYSQYLISGTYHRETSVFPGNFADQKASMHFNFNTTSANQKFQLSLSSNYLIDENKLPQTDLTRSAIQFAPDAPTLYNQDGSLNWAPNSSGNSTWDNPLLYLYQTYKNLTKNLISNLTLRYQIIQGLEIKSSFGYSNMQTNDFVPGPLIINRPENRANSSRYAVYGYRNLNSWIIEPQLTYSRNLGRGKLAMLVGSTLSENKTHNESYSASGFSSDQLLENIKAAASVSVSDALFTQYKYNAGFGRVNFNWDNKYVVNLTGRRDGSSRFGSKNRFHNFGSVGIAWLANEEKFFKQISFISFCKLRGSYGTTGNDQIGDYAYMSLYNLSGNNGIPYQNSTGLVPAGLPNPYLQWEETRKLQGGIDLGLLSDRIMINATFAHNRSSNQLLNYQLPSMVGFGSIVRNFPATVQNISWEFALNTINVSRNNFTWSSNLNVTIPKNKLVSFPDINTSTYSTSLFIGQPLNITQAYHLIGVESSTGLYQFNDKNGTPTYSPNDYTVLINTLPKYYGGILNTIEYKGFQLDVLFQYVKQIGNNFIYGLGSIYGPGAFSASGTNQPATVLNHWQKPGDLALFRKYSSKPFSGTPSYATQTINVQASDMNYADASYVRLKNASISWQLPADWYRKIHLLTARVFANGQNLYTITKYKGVDPENQTIGSLPPLRVWTLGIQLGL